MIKYSVVKARTKSKKPFLSSLSLTLWAGGDFLIMMLPSFFIFLRVLLSSLLLFDGAKQIAGGARIAFPDRDVLQLPTARRRNGRFHLHRRNDD